MIELSFEDVQEAVRIKTIERIVALGTHERARAAGARIHVLTPCILDRILRRGQRDSMTKHERFIDDVATLQLREKISTAKRAYLLYRSTVPIPN